MVVGKRNKLNPSRGIKKNNIGRETFKRKESGEISHMLFRA